MVQLTYHRILEHDIYFLDSEGRIAIPKKELDIVVIDNKREIVYLFECIHLQIYEINTKSTLLSEYIEQNYFRDVDIDGRYVIYNGEHCVKECGKTNVIFTLLDSVVNNYFAFDEHIKNFKHI